MGTFIEKCFEIFERVAKSHDLSKDVENYNKALNYRDKFYFVPRNEGEISNLIMKGAYDSIKLLNNLDKEQSDSLAKRIVNSDFIIFNEYRTM